MNKTIKLSILLCISIFFSCTPEEDIIDSTYSEYRYFCIGTSGRVFTVDPDSPDTQIIEHQIPGAEDITQITAWRDNIVAISESTGSISFLSQIDLNQRHSIDLSRQAFYPQKIVFRPGATGAYCISDTAVKIAVIDLTDYTFSKFIDLPFPVSDIAISGSFLYAVAPKNKSLLVIDTRLDKNPVAVPVRTRGQVLTILASADEAAIAGRGNPETGETAELIHFDLRELREIASKEISIPGRISSEEFFPSGIAASPSGNIFTSCQNNISLFRSYAGLFEVTRNFEDNLISLAYSKPFNLMYAYSGNRIYEINTETGIPNNTFEMPEEITAALPIQK